MNPALSPTELLRLRVSTCADCPVGTLRNSRTNDYTPRGRDGRRRALQTQSGARKNVTPAMKDAKRLILRSGVSSCADGSSYREQLCLSGLRHVFRILETRASQGLQRTSAGRAPMPPTPPTLVTPPTPPTFLPPAPPREAE